MAWVHQLRNPQKKNGEQKMYLAEREELDVASVFSVALSVSMKIHQISSSSK